MHRWPRGRSTCRPACAPLRAVEKSARCARHPWASTLMRLLALLFALGVTAVAVDDTAGVLIRSDSAAAQPGRQIKERLQAARGPPWAMKSDDYGDSAAVRRTSRWWFMGGGPWGSGLPWLNQSFADQAVELVATHRAAMTGVCVLSTQLIDLFLLPLSF